MRVRRQRRIPLAGAFWLLALAWLCANLRPATVTASLDWLAGSKRFSHQQRLTARVATLLAGDSTTAAAPATTVARTTPPEPTPPRPPAAPETPFKKLEVPLAREITRLAPPSAFTLAGVVDFSLHGRDRAAPPHGPPRAANAS